MARHTATVQAGRPLTRIARVLVLLSIVLLTLVSPGRQGQAAAAQAAGTSPEYGVVLVEHLRVKVPAEAVEAWIAAERGSWEPWLERQQGFLDRQLLWDPDREEGTLLIHWRSREAWQSIPQTEIDQVQQRFEALARAATGSEQGNPFPLVFEGQLLPQ